jgi:hypothetical protein
MKSQNDLKRDLETVCWSMSRYGGFTQDCRNMALTLAQLWGLVDAWGNIDIHLPRVQPVDVVQRNLGETIDTKENGKG